VVVLIGAWLMWRPGTSNSDLPAGAHSLAVLPFKPLVLAERDESLELGMTESLIARLSELDSSGSGGGRGGARRRGRAGRFDAAS
jgi:hypothetical protein